MCGRVIQSSGPLRYGTVEGLDVSDSRAKDNDTLIEEQEEEDADVTGIIGGDVENKEEG